MRSATPKPLHRLCGRPMVLHVIDALAELSIEQVIVVVGHGSSEVISTIEAGRPPGLHVSFVEQISQRGTGDAVAVGLTALPQILDGADEGDLLVLPGDTPLLSPGTLGHLVLAHRKRGAAATLLTAIVEDPSGYGRVLRGADDLVVGIVEDADAGIEALKVKEISTSVYCFRRSVLAPALRRLTPDNAKAELYLTDAISVLSAAGYPVIGEATRDPSEVLGVNDRAQLAAAEAVLRSRLNQAHGRAGVTMRDMEHTYLDVTVSIAAEVTLLPGVILEGATTVGAGARLGPSCRLVDCEVGAGAEVSYSVATGARLGDGCRVGPFMVLEPGTVVAPGAIVGPGRNEARW
jgi:bifunctional UDP-N-acetylglucosamine pyrophosphorylase/glucosamine-1-phosphate N-acetyltransferase